MADLRVLSELTPEGEEAQIIVLLSPAGSERTALVTCVGPVLRDGWSDCQSQPGTSSPRAPACSALARVWPDIHCYRADLGGWQMRRGQCPGRTPLRISPEGAPGEQHPEPGNQRTASADARKPVTGRVLARSLISSAASDRQLSGRVRPPEIGGCLPGWLPHWLRGVVCGNRRDVIGLLGGMIAARRFAGRHLVACRPRRRGADGGVMHDGDEHAVPAAVGLGP